MTDGTYKHSAFMSYAHDDDTAWVGWIKHFDAELNRCLPARLRDLAFPVPSTHFSKRNGPIRGPLNGELRAAVASSYAMVVFVHDNYLLSDWCLQELQHFRELYGARAMADRLFIVAMSDPAIKALETRKAWKELFPEPHQVWIPFFQGPDANPSQPIGIYLAAMGSEAVIGQAFLTPFFKLVGGLVESIRAAAEYDEQLFGLAMPEPAPAPMAAPDALLYIESEPGQEGYWDPLGMQVKDAWDREWALESKEPQLRLRPTGLPLHDLRNRPRLDNADGVILLWDQKTQESLLAQIEAVEPKLSTRPLVPGLIAYLLDAGSTDVPRVPRTIRGWPVVRFATRRSEPGTAKVVAEDEERLRTYLRHVREHKRSSARS